MNVLSKLRGYLSPQDSAVPDLELDTRLAARAAACRGDPALVDIVRQAWGAGQAIDVSDVVYGPAHWNSADRFSAESFPYYNFLAGLVASQSCRRIFEVGSHYGGSTLSMLRGMRDPAEGRIVTVDITALNPALHASPAIIKLVGDANTAALLQEAALAMGEGPIDLLYVDADHRFLSTLTNLGLYVLAFNPR